MITIKQLEEIVNHSKQQALHIKGYRIGQAFINNLPDDLYNFICSTSLDCFYNDSIYPLTLEFITEMIESYWKCAGRLP